MHDDGSVSNSPDGTPVVRAALIHEPETIAQARSTGIPQAFKRTPKIVYALVDTGADYNYADSDLIAHAGCPKLGTSVLQGATSTTDTTWHSAQIWFPDIERLVDTDVFATPLSENGRKYPLVIGMLTLKTGRLVLDFPNKVFRLYLY